MWIFNTASLNLFIAGKQFCLLNTGCIKLTLNEKPYLPATSSSLNISSPQLFHKFWFNVILKPHTTLFLANSLLISITKQTIKSNSGLYLRPVEFISPLRITLWSSFYVILLVPSVPFLWANLTNICVNLFSTYTMQNVRNTSRDAIWVL
jgi:hypothetical protein